MPKAKGCESVSHYHCWFTGASETTTELWVCRICERQFCHEEPGVGDKDGPSTCYDCFMQQEESK